MRGAQALPVRRGGHHYGIVFVLTTVTVVFSIATPDAAWSRGVGILLQGSTLLAVLLAADSPRLRHSGVPVLLITVVGSVLAAFSVLPDAVAHGIWAVFAFATLGEVAAGVVRLIRQQRGVTIQVVFGGLVIYLLLGTAFALAISVGAALSDGPWFAQGTDGTLSERIYFSFAALTTTGFGDLTAGTRAGRALAVLEMLTGQLYLVTVIGVLVGGVARRPR